MSTSKKSNITLWTVQGVLAALFLFAGVSKLLTPAEALEAQAHLSGGFLKFIGVVETLGALGLILPGLTRIHTELTPLAAAGLVSIMTGATTLAFVMGTPAFALPPVVVGSLCAFVAYSRRRLLFANPTTGIRPLAISSIVAGSGVAVR